MTEREKQADNSPHDRCCGTLPDYTRRAFLRSGLVGLWTLPLARLLELEAKADAATKLSPRLRVPASPRRKSMIVVWLWGGPSHMETFDMKPDAPIEYRGDFKPISTNVPGIQICEHLPQLARLADKYVILRTLHHNSPGHVNSTHTVMTGYDGELNEAPPYRPKYPDFWAVTNKLRGDWERGVPPFVALPRMRYNGAAYIGNDLDPLQVTSDPNTPEFKIGDLVTNAAARSRISRRASLLELFDGRRRMMDALAPLTPSPLRGERAQRDGGAFAQMEAFSEFQKKALSVLTSDAAATAFDINKEDPKLRDRYGRNPIGQRCLLARRLVEAGARIVTVDFPCVPGQKAFSWDDHASVWNIFEQMKIRLPVLDQCVAALIEDIYQRGLQNDVLLVVMGEMGRTPKLSNYNGQPGREHWSKAISVLMSGGGMPMGQVIGQTNPRGEEPVDRPITPSDLLATWYTYFGIPTETQFVDPSGRPVSIIAHGEPIRELM